MIPAASAVAGFSPTERRFNPTRVLLSTNDTINAIIIARYVKKSYDKNNSPKAPKSLAKGNLVEKNELVFVSAIDGNSLFVMLISEAPRKLPKPIPSVVRQDR